MLNYETILSSYDDKMTLMQWLKKVEEALNGASLTGVELKKKGNATFAWSFDFEDGTHIDTEYVTINEGDSVAEAYLLNGHLMIKLTNDEVIDAGNLKPVTSFSFNSQRHLIVSYGDGTTQDLGLIKGVSSFTIDANQHLIVNYDNGTTQDLGAIFNGNINIDGNLNVSGKGSINELEINNYLESKDAPYNVKFEINPILTSYVKTSVPFNIARHSNGKFNIVLCLAFEILQDFTFSSSDEITLPSIVYNNVPTAIMEKLFILGGTEYTINALLDAKYLPILRTDDGSGREQTFKVGIRIIKRAVNTINVYFSVSLSSNYNFSFTQGQQFAIRFEDNFVL